MNSCQENLPCTLPVSLTVLSFRTHTFLNKELTVFRSLLKYRFRNNTVPDHLFKKQQNITRQNPSSTQTLYILFPALVFSIAHVAIQYIYMISLFIHCWLPPTDDKFYESRPFVSFVQLWIFSRCLAQNRSVISICWVNECTNEWMKLLQ